MDLQEWEKELFGEKVKLGVKKRYLDYILNSTITTPNKEDHMAKKAEAKKTVPTVNKKEAEVKQPVVRARLPHNVKAVPEFIKQGLKPHTPEWDRYYRKHKNEQMAMLEYKNKNFVEVDPEEEQKKKNREEELRLQKEWLEKNKKKGKKEKSSKGYALEEEEYNFEDEEDDDDLDDYTDETDDEEEKHVHKKIPTTKKEVRVKKEPEKAIPRTVNKPIGDGKSTFDDYTIEIPEEIMKRIKPLIKWIREEDRPILEFRHGQLKAYQRRRVTSTGRVAVVTVKKQGERNIVTYRSNKNSRRVD